MTIQINPDNKDLRNFALIMGAMIGLFFGLLIPWIWDLAHRSWPWVVAGIFAVWGLILPVSLKPVFWIWMKIGHVLGWVNTRLLLSIVFYGLILPFGFFMRIFGKDPMSRAFDGKMQSYRVESEQPITQNLDKPF